MSTFLPHSFPGDHAPRRILILANMPIYPANVGNKARIATLLQELQDAGHEVWFGGLGLTEAEAAPMRAALGERFLCAPFQPLWKSEDLPTALAKGLAIRLAGRGWLVPDIDLWYRREWDAAIASWDRAHHFDAVLVEYVFFSRALLNFGPEILKLIDTHDVFADRYKKLRKNGIRRFWFVTDKVQERRGLARADVVIAIQDHEAAYFRQETSSPVVVVGHGVRLEPLPASEEPLVGYFGSENAANIQALEAFLEEVWPLIRKKIPDARLLVGGGIAARFAPREDVELMGHVKDPADFYARASVLVNPMRVGTGLKIKSIEALGFGRALVTTTVGAHGLEAGASRAFVIADRPAEMAEAVCRLLDDPARRSALAGEASAFAQKRNDETRAVLHGLFRAPTQPAALA